MKEGSDESNDTPTNRFADMMRPTDHQYDKVVSLITKEPRDRNNEEIDQIKPWFKKKSDLLNQLNDEIIHDLIKNCELSAPVERDYVIIKQGDKGNCFFIILNGSVGIYINTTYTPEEATQEEPEKPNTLMVRRESRESLYSDKSIELDRSKYGNYVGKLNSGKSFGELALINPDCVRNATIIAEEDTDLIVIDRDLYNRCIRSFHEKEFAERKGFVENNSFFDKWNPKYKKQMAMSLRKEKLNFESIIVKQGTRFDGIRFLLSGQANLTCDPRMHCTQYSSYYPLPDVEHLEEEEARESLRRELHMPSQKHDHHKITDMNRQKLTAERSVSPKPRRHRNTELCLISGEEVIGDLEVAMSLPTYAYSVVCIQETEFYVLDLKNYERLIEKRNPQVIEIMRYSVLEKYSLRLSWLKDKNAIPFFRYLLYKIAENYRRKKLKKDEIKRQEKERHSPKQS